MSNRSAGEGWSECHCSCHGANGEVMADHIMACCAKCPWCERNIVGDVEQHIVDIHPECVGHVRPILGLQEALNLGRQEKP